MSEDGGGGGGGEDGSVKGISRYEQVSGSRNKGSAMEEEEGIDKVKVMVVETKRGAGEGKRE